MKNVGVTNGRCEIFPAGVVITLPTIASRIIGEH
jgi:hypothetical protein